MVAVLLTLPCWRRSLFVFSGRRDVEEGIVNYKGTRNHLYEGRGEGRCVRVGVVEAGTPMRIGNFSVVYIFSRAAFRVGFTCGNLH